MYMYKIRLRTIGSTVQCYDIPIAYCITDLVNSLNMLITIPVY